MKSYESGHENKSAAEVQQDLLTLISDALDASEDGFAIWKSVRDDDGSITDFVLLLMNTSGLEGLDKNISNPVGMSIEQICGDETATGLSNLFRLALSEGHSVKEVVPGLEPDGSRGSFENTVVPFGRDLVFATYRDVSVDQREHKKLLWLTEHDFLTGMPNRAKLQEFLGESYLMSNEHKTMMAFVFIDIDYFKQVNDRFGHDAGDALLVNFVKRIRHSLPERALVARIAGDEFGICIQDVKDMQQLKELMENVFTAMKRPFTFDHVETSISCSAGCVITDGSVEPEEIMRVADKLMYQAKNEGRTRFVIEPLMATT
jgi:diguanylate cyclase (GGDEF)-like protein